MQDSNEREIKCFGESEHTRVQSILISCYFKAYISLFQKGDFSYDSFSVFKTRGNHGWEDMCFKKLLDCSFRKLDSELPVVFLEAVLFIRTESLAQVFYLPGEISITSDMQMIPPLWQKVKRN